MSLFSSGPASRIGRLCEQYRKINIFYFHAFCTRNGDYLIVLKKGSVHKKKMSSQTVIKTFIKCEAGD